MTNVSLSVSGKMSENDSLYEDESNEFNLASMLEVCVCNMNNYLQLPSLLNVVDEQLGPS